jgi:hypothetical protein
VPDKLPSGAASHHGQSATSRLATTIIFMGSLIRPVTDEDRLAALALLRTLSIDKKLSLCDLISHPVVTTYLNNVICLAFDDDFTSLGLPVIS